MQCNDPRSNFTASVVELQPILYHVRVLFIAFSDEGFNEFSFSFFALEPGKKEKSWRLLKMRPVSNYRTFLHTARKRKDVVKEKILPSLKSRDAEKWKSYTQKRRRIEK